MSKLIYKRYEKFLRRYFECETHERLKVSLNYLIKSSLKTKSLMYNN